MIMRMLLRVRNVFYVASSITFIVNRRECVCGIYDRL